jgi:subtilisin family serine protease
MKSKIFHFLSLALLMSILLVSCVKENNTSELPVTDEIVSMKSQLIENKYIIVFKDQSATKMNQKQPQDYKAAREVVERQAYQIFAENSITDAFITHSYSKALNGVAVTLNPADIKRLATDDRIKYIEQDRVITLAPPSDRRPGGGGGGGTPPPQVTPYGITRVNGVSNYTGSNVAWIIDTGIDIDHPDLNVDASRGFNTFSSGKDGSSLDDGNGHGTHVSGTIAAKNNSIGVIGVAPGATVIPVKVLNSRGSGSYSGVIAGVDFVAANGSSGDVANMSLGGPVSAALDNAVIAAAANGIKFALAAGNESDNADNHSPARANGANIYTISAMNSSDNWASFSNYGNPPVDYCAPGVSILSTWKDGGYNTISGTSMAAPHAAGVLLLGTAKSGGTVNNDPDGNRDQIIVH